jgi:hypothetical protein
MTTEALPPLIRRLLAASLFVSTTAFVVTIVHIGVFKFLKQPIGAYSLVIVPISWFLTVIHHVTLFLLSKRRPGPPPIPTSPTNVIQNNSRSSVYRPASPHTVPFMDNNQTLEEHHDSLRTNTYPLYAVSTLNCVASFLLALLWSGGVWSTIDTAIGLAKGRYRLNEHPGAEVALSVLECMFGYVQIVLMWVLFSRFMNNRYPRLERPRKEFIRMDG